MNTNSTYRIIQSIIAIGLAVMLFSCKNDLQEIRSLDFSDTLPDLTAYEIEMLYSENAEIQIKLISPKLVRFGGEKPFSEFPEGFVVLFYDSLNQVKSTISADYGINFEKENLMEARYNVIIENLQKNEKLNTEELFWDQDKAIIYSNKFVKLTRDEEIITGDGLHADQGFEQVEIKNPRGLIEFDEEEEEQ